MVDFDVLYETYLNNDIGVNYVGIVPKFTQY